MTSLDSPTGTHRPLILVDVDGVLNPSLTSGERSRLWSRGRWRYSEAWVNRRRYPLFLNPEHGAWLRDLAGQTGAELAWASTWEDRANQFVGPPIGLPPLAFAPAPPHHKAQSVVAWTAGRPFAWLDDSADELAEAERLATGQPHLCVLVDENSGLAREHLSQVREWLQGLETLAAGQPDPQSASSLRTGRPG